MGDRPDLDAIVSQAERGPRTLATGILLFRWVALAWTAVLTATSTLALARPSLAWGLVAVALGWTAWLTVTRSRAGWIPWVDLAHGVSLILLSAVSMRRGALLVEAPFIGGVYPAAPILLWAARAGPWAGLGAALVEAVGLVAARPLNGIGIPDLARGHVQGILGSIVILCAAGVTVGLVARLLERSALEVRLATEAAIEAREEAARLAERESLARRIHDSVLQALAMIHKRGRELGERESVPGTEARRLAEMAREQERALRGLIVRPHEPPPEGMASLRERLEALSGAVSHPLVEVSATGSVWMPIGSADEVTAAVRQALENVVRHAGARRVTVHVDREDGVVTVSVRDDGRGFDYDETALREAGKLGILSSMKGRIRELGGEVRITTAPGSGTEVELRIPSEGWR